MYVGDVRNVVINGVGNDNEAEANDG